MIKNDRAKLLVAVFSSILAMDVITKWLAHSFLPLMQRLMLPFPYGGIGVFENIMGINFSITHQTNTGAAWGIFPDAQKTLLYVRVVVILAMAIYLVFFNKNRQSQIPFVFVIAGALGNVLDSLYYGHVVDLFFFQFWGYDFPVFNIADTFIFLGVAWLCIVNLKPDKSTSASSVNTDDSQPFDSSPFS